MTVHFHSIFNALFLLYAIIQITEINAVALAPVSGISHVSIGTLAIIIPIVISVAEVAYIALGWKIYTEFGWKVYKFLGADRRIKTMFAHHQIFLCLVKFDLFFWVGFSVQFIFLVLARHDAEFYLTCAALPLSLVVLVEGHLAARHESKYMMLAFMAGCGGAMVYFVYKVGEERFICRDIGLTSPSQLVKVLRFRDTVTFAEVWQTLTTFCTYSRVFDEQRLTDSLSRSRDRYHPFGHYLCLRPLGDEQLRSRSQGAEYVFLYMKLRVEC